FGNAIILTFSDCEGGLFARGGELKNFAIGGSDGRFVPAKAELTGYDQITIEVPKGVQGEFVRYAWQDYFEPTLINADGCPAAPFRTDTLPVTTDGSEYQKRRAEGSPSNAASLRRM